MKLTTMTKVTIVAQDSLQEILFKELKELGVKGYTYVKVSGAGELGVRPNEWYGPNVRIEVITTKERATTILEHVARRYFKGYLIIAYLSDIRVARPEKYDEGRDTSV